jgi:hypothetical protein
MRRSLSLVAFLAITHLSAADFSGRWAGIMETNGGRAPIYLNLSQHGGTISGSVVTGTEMKPAAIDKTELRDEAVFFEVLDNTNRLMRFRLTLNGGVLSGEATVANEVLKIAVVLAGGGRGDRIGSGAGAGVDLGTANVMNVVGSGVYRFTWCKYT